MLRNRVTARRVAAMLALLAAVLGVAVAPMPGTAAQKPLVIGWTSYPADAPVIGLAIDGAKTRANQTGVKIEFALAAGAAAQATAVENLLAKGIDVLAIDPEDSTAIGPSVKLANQRGVPVIMWIGDNLGGGRTVTLISSDEQRGGYAIANWGFRKLGGKGKVALIQGTKAHQAGLLRETGFRAALQKFPGVDLAAYGEANWQRDKANTLATDMLTKNPDLQMIFGFTDEMAKGIFAATKAQGKKPMVLGYNGDCETLGSIWKGQITATLYQGWREIGVKIVDTAIKVGKKQPVPKKIVMPVAVMDKAAMRSVSNGTYKGATPSLKKSVSDATRGCK